MVIKLIVTNPPKKKLTIDTSSGTHFIDCLIGNIKYVYMCKTGEEYLYKLNTIQKCQNNIMCGFHNHIFWL